MVEPSTSDLYRQRGRPPKKEVKGRLVKILKEKKMGTTHRLGKIYQEWYSEDLSWNTVKKYLTKLVQEGKVVRQVSISHSNGNQVVVYKLAIDGEEK